jgi:hypothetical protein
VGAASGRIIMADAVTLSQYRVEFTSRLCFNELRRRSNYDTLWTLMPSPNASWIAFAMLTALEIVLGIDNVGIFISGL